MKWSPDQYRLFLGERSQPFHDLLLRVDLPEANRIADLGCGTGELTASLAERWPRARVWGVDSSPEMIAAAEAHSPDTRVSFEVADLTHWKAAEPLDLVVANASLHWVPDHEVLLPRLVEQLRPGGVLAVQQPGNFGAPSHRLLLELCAAERWREKLGFLLERAVPVQEPDWYLTYLIQLGLPTQAWETTYYHVLQGEDPVLEWVTGTALRPVLDALDVAEQVEFRTAYGAALREAYPSRPFGTVFPFRRVFFVARK